MNFESLSSEIFFEVFDYLDSIHIFHTFYNLNYRFNDLLFNYFRVVPQFNFKYIIKKDFDNVCRDFLPLIVNQIQSFHLSNDDYMPQQTDLFLSYGFNFCKFPRLKSLSLHNIHSKTSINRMMTEWQYSNQLTHLRLTNCRIMGDWDIFDTLINNIWSLSTLTHCYLDLHVDGDYFFKPIVISSTIRSLSIKNIVFTFEQLIDLFECTPYLRYVDVSIYEENTNHIYLFTSLPLITTLKLDYEGPFDTIKDLFENVPNLHHLTILIKHDCIEGQQWEEIIRNYLPKLTIFHLLMEWESEWSTPPLVNTVDTYRSDFWLNEHQWYVQGHCYFNRSFRSKYCFIYTLPYVFNYYDIKNYQEHVKQTTRPTISNHTMSYKHVHHLSYICLPKHAYQFPYQFSYIHHLVLTLPSDRNFWTAILTFEHLRILEILLAYTKVYNQKALYQLEYLLERAPKLYSLTFKSSSTSSILPLLECHSPSLIKLAFQTSEKYFTHSNCTTLFFSILGRQCQILSIRVSNRNDIIQLIKEIPQLHTLYVEYLPEEIDANDEISNNNQMISWLRYHLRHQCTIAADSTHSNRIEICIYQEKYSSFI